MGFFSGGHCLGMCGPLVLALPVSEGRVWVSVFYRLVYNFGRVFTYTILGGIAGAVAVLFSLQVLQARVVQIAGALLILLAVLQLLPHIRFGFLSRAHAFIAKGLAPLLRNAGQGRFLLLGMLNGILPCGMVAAALLVSIAAETWLSGIAYMAVFGLGTFPLMLLASVFGIYLSGGARQIVSWAGPLYAIALGILLLLRPALIAPHCLR